MAWFAEAVRELAHGLYTQEPLVQERRAGSNLRATAIAADPADQNRGDRAGFDLGQSPSGWYWGVKYGPQAIGKSRGGWNTKVHLVAAHARTAIVFALSPGYAHDAPEVHELLRDLPPMPEGLPLLMDRAYEGNETRQLVLELGLVPVVPPKVNRVDPGATTARYIGNATRWSASSAGSRATGASSLVSKSSMLSFSASSPSPSSSKPLHRVNRPYLKFCSSLA